MNHNCSKIFPSKAKEIFEPRYWVSQLSALRGQVQTRRKVSWKNSQMEEHFDLLVNVPLKYMVIYRDGQNPATGCVGTVRLSASFSSPVFPTKEAHAHYFCFKDYNHAVTRSDSNNQNKVVLLHVKNYSCAYIKVSAH